MRWFTAVCVLAGLVGLAACNKGSSVPTPNFTPTPSASPSATPSPYMGPRIGAYNVAPTTTTVTTYPLLSTGFTNPTQLITGSATGLGPGTAGIAFDQSGNIYVGVGNTTTTILVFNASATQNTPPMRTMQLPILALGIATDALGNFYTANFMNGAIYRFRVSGSGIVSPTQTFTPYLDTPSGFRVAFPHALNTGGNALFCGCAVSSNGTVSTAGVSEYTFSSSGTAQLEDSFYDTELTRAPQAIAVDTVAKVVYLGETVNGAPAIFAYAYPRGGSVKPQRTITGNNTGIQSINGLAVGPDEELYVADAGSHQIEVFAPNANGNAVANRVISDPNMQFSPVGNSIAIH